MTKVLLADDSITMQKVTELILPENAFELKTVNNGEEALSVLESFKPDIVLADIEMPAMNGYRLCEEIKNNPDTRGILVLLLAGAFEPLDEELTQKVGADGSLVKPFESGDLIDKINAVLEAKAGKEGVAGVEVDAAEEDVLEAVHVEEEFWEMEDIEKPTDIPEEAAGEALEEVPLEEILEDIAVEEKPSVAAAVEEIGIPDTRKLSDMFKAAADEKLSEMLAGLDLKALVLEAITPAMKDSVEHVLWEVAPELTEKLLRETLKDTMASLTKELENVIWETVPELAESIIRKEIEKIRAESIRPG